VQASATSDTCERLGSPEGELAIEQCVIYLATAPKSNAAYEALGEARGMAHQTGSLMPPMNVPTRLMRDLGYSKGYVYDQATGEHFSGQNYVPDRVSRRNFYRPDERGYEREIKSGSITGTVCGAERPLPHELLSDIGRLAFFFAPSPPLGAERAG
jgi:putative ATPase